MNVNDIYLISPEISLVGLGLLLLSLDLLWKKKEFFPYVAFLGLFLPIILSVCLWYDINKGVDIVDINSDGTAETEDLNPGDGYWLYANKAGWLVP